MKLLVSIFFGLAVALVPSRAPAVTFTVELDLRQLLPIPEQFGLALDWGESTNSPLNTLTLSDFSGLIPLGAPVFPPSPFTSGDLNTTIVAHGGGEFWQAFTPTTAPLHFVLSLTNNRTAVDTNDGEIVIGVIPLDFLGGLDSLRFLHIGVDRPLLIGAFA